MTVVSQMITDARTRHGADAVEVIEVTGSLLDQTMDHVLSLGGEVGLDYCVVEGVTVRELPAQVDMPRVHVRGEPEPKPIVTGE